MKLHHPSACSPSQKYSRALLQLAMAGMVAVGSVPAHAIVSSSAGTSLLGSDVGGLDGVAKLAITQNGGATAGCSGALLAGGGYVLTAAHCVSDTAGQLNAQSVSLSFNGGAVTAAVGSASQITLFSTWSGTLGQNNDLALLKLDAPVTAISGHSVYAADPIGMPILLTGYGYTGVGSTGYVSGTFGTLHAGTNQYEAYYLSPNGNYLYDFDQGTPDTNLFGSFGTTYEAIVAPGDSGGGSFVPGSNGDWYLAGVHSFLARGTTGDIDATINGTFGELAGDSMLFSTATTSWLSSVVSAVPEPSTSLLMLLGLVGIGTVRHRIPKV